MKSRRLSASVLRSLSSVFLLFTGAVLAQNPPPAATMTPPPGMDVAAETVQASTNAPVTAVSAAPEKKAGEEWERELLRDPFWPVGYFPADWKKEKKVEDRDDLEGTGWKAASAKLRISGTSQLGGRTAAIINGELKVVNDPVEVFYEGKTYQWQVVEIGADGQIQLKKLGIR